jgi:hypothetical protein
MTELFLLKRYGWHYRLTSGTFGAFEIDNDRLRFVARANFVPEYSGVPVDVGIRSMLDLLNQE